MAEPGVNRIGGGRPTDPIQIIAAAERERAAAQGAPAPDASPDLAPPSRPLAPQGMAGLLDHALGPVRLPTLLELAEALELARVELDLSSEMELEMAEVVTAVLEDERAKVLRYLDLRDR